MVTTLYLIRHGETVGAEVRRYKGSIDVPLSGSGVKQMEELSSYLFNLVMSSPNADAGIATPLTAVYCSGLSRARLSAEIIATPYSISPMVVDSIRERNFGVWEGMSFDEIREKYPEEFDAWARDPLRFSPIQGESTLEVRDRVIGALEEIIARHSGERVGIVAHGGVNRIILCHLLGSPLDNIFRVEQDYAALNIIEFWDRYPVLKLVNGTIFRKT